MVAQATGELDYVGLVAASGKLKLPAEAPGLKIALLADAATQQFVPLLKTLLARKGIRALIYEGAFAAIELEALDSRSGLYAFDPDAIVLINSVQALRASFSARSGDPQAFVDQTMRTTSGIWSAIRSRSRATIIQSTFALPYERFFGNRDLTICQSFYSVARSLNDQIVSAARERAETHINDVEWVASWVGRSRFCDDRAWDLWKTFCALEYLPLIAKNIVDILAAQRGHITKCVVMDLDNTLWGGAIGDDGLNGITLNRHGDGEGFYRFQHFLKELRRRGILLAVCSKNDEANARSPFQEHPEMVLSLEDITLFVANWDSKVDNLRMIRDALNIGFDSMVFVDDSLFERNLVRAMLPQVIVPEMPDDPSDYVRSFSELNLFETTCFSPEDAARTELYKREAERRKGASEFNSVDEYLQWLAMKIVIRRFDSFHLPRIAQLIQRSNQFNLTSRRHSQNECEEMMTNGTLVPLYVKLSDRLGDHGLISIAILQAGKRELIIRDWLMSCRVLGRGVEQFLMNEVVSYARRLGVESVVGDYIPTGKNALVRDFYGQFGFSRAPKKGYSRWMLDTRSFQPITTWIEASESILGALDREPQFHAAA